MRAVKLVGPGALRLEEAEVPQPGSGEARVKIAGAGLCHSDLHVLHAGADWPFFGGTVGHEGAGWVGTYVCRDDVVRRGGAPPTIDATS